MTLQASPKSISSLEEASGPLQPDLLAGLTVPRSGPEAAPASRSRRRAKVLERMIQGICGRTFIASSVPAGPLSSWESRLRERLATVGSTESALIWREKVTPAGRSISRLAVSTRHTNGTGSTGSQWRSPNVVDAKGGTRKGEGQVQLTHQIADTASMWATVSVVDGQGRGYQMSGGRKFLSLPGQMDEALSGPKATWGTVTANPANGEPEAFLERKRRSVARGSSMGVSLTDVAMQMKAVAYVPTPTVADVQGGRKARSGARSNEPLLNGLCFEMEPTGPTPTGSNATTAKRGAPNPVFAFWLMGFPAEWTSGALEAMRSYRKPRRK